MTHEEQILAKCPNCHYNTYNPIILDGKVYIDGRRKFAEQYKRLDFIDYEGNRILDIGCYNGFFATEAIKRGAIKYIGLDSNSESDGFERILDIAEIVKDSNKLTNVDFIEGECENIHNIINVDDIDIVTVLSIQPANHLIGDFINNNIPFWYDHIKHLTVYIEPTNHYNPIKSTSVWENEIEMANKNTKGVTLELLTITDYQNRPLIKITHKEI